MAKKRIESNELKTKVKPRPMPRTPGLPNINEEYDFSNGFIEINVIKRTRKALMQSIKGRPKECLKTRTADSRHLERIVPEDVANPTDIQSEANRLRKLLKLYLYSAVKWQGDTCSFHVIYLLILLIHVLKVILITTQMFDFGYDHGNFSDAVLRGHFTLRHLLLKGWDASWETSDYPPAHGQFALYTVEDVEESINFAVTGYYNANTHAAGYYIRTPEDGMHIKIKYFDFHGFKEAIVDDRLVITERMVPIDKGLSISKDEHGEVYSYNITKEFEYQNLTQPIKRMLSADLHFNIHSVRVFEKLRHARCLRIEGWVQLRDLDNTGQTKLDLETLTRRILCKTINVTVEDMSLENTNKSLGSALVTICLLSLLITVINIVFGGYVCWRTKMFMRKHYKSYYKPIDKKECDLPMREYFRFVKFSDLIVIVSDSLTLYGTIEIIFNTEENEWLLATLDAYTVWLGVGCIMAWITLLRFFKFHNKFHMLFSTLYHALGDVIAYLFCVSLLFCGYWVGGYMVLGAYHVKFKTPGSAAETLLALINGDEIYATLAMFEEWKAGPQVYWFSRIYICSYVAVYTIVVVNLLIAIYLSAYETIKEYYKDKPEERDLGPMEKALRRYLNEQQDDTNKEVNLGLRTSIYGLLCNKGKLSTGEDILRKELQKIVKVSDTTSSLILLKPKTLKGFMRDEDDLKTVVGLGCINFAFVRFFGKPK